VAALGQGSLDARAFGYQVTVRRVYDGSHTQFEAINRAIELHALRPVIDRVFGFRETIEAFRYFEARNHIGKVVIAGD
jgi:NADPH:quinone reductase-like Zn-dependent oxidoreductase